jgi:predicted small metal-binding protein
MKSLKCSEIGGPATCTTEFKTETSEEMIKQGWEHIETEHPELAENIKNNPKEVNDKWMSNFHATFSSLPEVSE